MNCAIRDGWISQMVRGKFCEVWQFLTSTEKLYLGPFGKHDLARANSTKVAYKNLSLPKKQYQKYQIWVGM